MNSADPQLLPVKDEAGTASIAYYFAPARRDNPVFVWFCGFKSEMRSLKAVALAEWAARRGAGCLRFDYSGHGLSSGRFEDGTVSGWLDQAGAVCATALSGREFVFVGSSMGGWIALLLARQLEARGAKAPKGIVLIAPAWNMTQLMWDNATGEARATLMRDGVFLRPSAYGDEPYAIAKSLIEDGANHLLGEGTSIDCPVRVIHGCKDADIPFQHSLRLMDILSGDDVRLTLVKDAGHRLSRPQDLALLFAALEKFLRTN